MVGTTKGSGGLSRASRLKQVSLGKQEVDKGRSRDYRRSIVPISQQGTLSSPTPETGKPFCSPFPQTSFPLLELVQSSALSNDTDFVGRGLPFSPTPKIVKGPTQKGPNKTNKQTGDQINNTKRKLRFERFGKYFELQ